MTGNQILQLIDDNIDWLNDAEDPALFLSALVAATERQEVPQPVAA